MELYTALENHLRCLPHLEAWPEMRRVFSRSAAQKPKHWRLPLLICEDVGGGFKQALPAVAALACQQIGIVLIDDMLDEDPCGTFRSLGKPACANLASAFQAISLEAIWQSEINPAMKLAAIGCLNQMVLTTTFGQHLDSQNPADEAAYWQVVQKKSGSFFGAAFALGALFGEADQRVVEALQQVGSIYGEMIQIHDDINDALAVPANPDWLLGRSSLPLLYTRLVEHPDRKWFMELCEGVEAAGVLKEAQTILLRCGALSYCIDQLVRRHNKARELLARISPAHGHRIEALLNEVLAPVMRMFRTIGSDQDGELLTFSDLC